MREDPDVPDRQDYPDDDPQIAIRRIDLSDEEVENYYHGLANRVLWPVSHYMIHHLELAPPFIRDYRAVNRRFAEAVVEEYREGDYVWVQDYHLMLAPQLIREALPGATTAQFWHVPWPAMEVFRILPWARELLRGMLGCDLIGFHVEEYVEHFLESARVLLGADVRGHYVRWGGRDVRVEAHPIGIDVDGFAAMAADPEVRQAAAAIRDEVRAEKLIVGIDRLDYTKGILERLLAFERFLECYPAYRGRATLFQIATPSRTEVETYQQL